MPANRKAGLEVEGTEMSNLRAITLGAALLAGSVTAASAADLARGSIKDGYVPVGPAYSSPMTWYGRIDGGFARYDDTIMVEHSRYDLHTSEIDSTWGLGAGVGYYFSKNVRADITWDHRFETDARGTMGIGGGFPFDGGTRNFGLKSDVFLANIYYDFDLRSRFTPYIGMGIGTARNTTTAGSVTDLCGCTGTVEGASEWSVAGSLMSGFSFAMRDRLHLDAGYRYLYLGDAKTGQITGTGASVGTNSGSIAIQDITSHEFRVGLRYDIR